MHFTAHCVYEATNPTMASNKTDPSLVAHESDNRPRPFNIKITRDTNTNAEDCKDSLVVSSHSPKASEEQGYSIAKVLEWFSRSSDSSDKHDCEDIIQDTEEDIKIEDIDFEEELNSRPKPENNVYLIIPRHRDEDSAMLNEKDLSGQQNLEKKELSLNSHGAQELIGQTKPLSIEALSAMGSSSLFSHSSPQDTTNRLQDPEKTRPKEKMLETASKKEESKNADKTGIPDSKHKLEDLEESQSPKITSLRSLWDKGTAEAPKMLMSKPNINSEKENLDQNIFVRKVIEYEEEPNNFDISQKSGLESKQHSHVKEISNVDELDSDTKYYEYSNKKDTSIRDKPNQALVSNRNQTKDVMALNTTSDKYVTNPLGQKSSSSLDFGLQMGDQNNENVEGNVHSSKEGHMPAAVLELDQKLKTEGNESQLNLAPTSGVYSQQQNPVPLAKQNRQQQDNREEKINELKSFWERERSQSKVYMNSIAANDTNSSGATTKLNKRFTKSEYDLRSIGTESESGNATFTVLRLQDRMEKTATGEGMNSLQFKMIRDFWAGASKQSSNFENKTQNPLSQEVKHTKTHKEEAQLELTDEKYLLNQNICLNQPEKGFGNYSGNTMPPKTDRGLQSSLKEKNVVKHPDTGTTAILEFSRTEPDFLRSTHCPHPKSGLQISPKDTASSKPTGMLNKESQQQTSGKGTLNGRGNSLRRATSMFAINMEHQGQDLPLQSKKVSDTVPQKLGRTTESTVLPSTGTPESNVQMKKSPEITKSRHKMTERSMCEDSDPQPLARSFVPRDYPHYLGITENRAKYISPQVIEQMSKLVCTPFQIDGSVSCCAEQADAPLDTAEIYTRRGSLRLQPSVHASEDVNPETLNRDDSFSGASTNCEKYIFFLY